MGIDSVTVFINGTLKGATVYNIPLRRSNPDTFTVGNSYGNDAPFNGEMQAFKIYMSGITNRETAEDMSGKLPKTRTLPNCRCPFSHPKINKHDTLCERNDGPNRPNTPPRQVYRLSELAHPPQYVNDNNLDTYWISAPGRKGPISVSVDLGTEYQVYCYYSEVLTDINLDISCQ